MKTNIFLRVSGDFSIVGIKRLQTNNTETEYKNGGGPNGKGDTMNKPSPGGPVIIRNWGPK